MQESNFISIDDNSLNNSNNPNSGIFEVESEPSQEKEEVITNIPDWSIEPPIEINRGNDEL